MATKPRGGGAKGLSGRAFKKRFFFAASLSYVNNLFWLWGNTGHAKFDVIGYLIF